MKQRTENQPVDADISRRDFIGGTLIGSGAADTGEFHDLVVVGGGFAGMTAAYTFLKHDEEVLYSYAGGVTH